MSNPKFIALAVMTLDGKIAKTVSHESSWSSKEDKKFLRKKIDRCDVIVVGRNTYEVSHGPLSKRNCIVITSRVATTTEPTALCRYVNPKTVNIKTLVQSLGYRNICILGGTRTYSLMLKLGLIDELFLTIEPLLFGSGLSLFDLPLKNAPLFRLVSVKKLNRRGTILLHYRR